MPPKIGIFYATREGQTRRIAERIAADLRERDFGVELHNVVDCPVGMDLRRFAGLILAASTHVGEHEAEMVTFVKHHLSQLETIPAAFLSVSLTAAGAERSDATPEERIRFSADLQKILDRFSEETGWLPQYVRPVAGALMYSKYNFLVKLVLRRIAKKAHAGTDTSRDYEYTDWEGLDHFATEFAEQLRLRERRIVPLPVALGDSNGVSLSKC
jgi:menaquinone-dependent protoporphyrinogen oxidase